MWLRWGSSLHVKISIYVFLSLFVFKVPNTKHNTYQSTPRIKIWSLFFCFILIGTNVQKAKELMDASGLKLIAVDDLDQVISLSVSVSLNILTNISRLWFFLHYYTLFSMTEYTICWFVFVFLPQAASQAVKIAKMVEMAEEANLKVHFELPLWEKILTKKQMNVFFHFSLLSSYPICCLVWESFSPLHHFGHKLCE